MTELLRRYSDLREVHVRVPFSGVPITGGWFAIRPPDHLVTLQTAFTEAFLIQDIEVHATSASAHAFPPFVHHLSLLPASLPPFHSCLFHDIIHAR